MAVTRIAIALALASLALPAPAEQRVRDNGQQIYRWGSPEHETIRWLAVEAGQALPSGTGAFSAAELLLELERIAPHRLSPVSRERWAQLRVDLMPRPRVLVSGVDAPSAVRPGAMELGVRAAASVSTEVYASTNRDVPAREVDVRERAPMVLIPLEIWAGNRAYGRIGLDFRKFNPAPGGALTKEPDPFTNVLFTEINALDLRFPSSGYLSVGGANWNVQFGRDDVSWGNGHTGNLYLSDWSGEFDFARLTGFWRNFKFSTIWLSMASQLSPEEATLRDDPTSKYSTIRDLHNSFLAHRFEVRLWDRVSLIATEGTMYGGDDMELRYLNPFVLYHNQFINPLPANIHMSYEIDVAVARGLSVHLQLSPDQWSAPQETGSYTVNEPNALGYLAGFRGVIPARYGTVSLVGEAAYLTRWMYIHQLGYTTINSRRWMPVEYFLAEGQRRLLVSDPLGYYTGNDSAVIALDGWWQGWQGGRLGLATRLEFRGEGEITDTLPVARFGEANLTEAENRAVAPSGVVERTTVVQLRGALPELSAGPRHELVISGNIAWLTILNAENVVSPLEHDVQATISLTARFR